MTTYFVSGVAGFLGSHVADALIKRGHRVVGADNLIGGYLDNVHPQVEFHQIDLINREALVLLLRGIEVIYHCAAMAYEGLSVFSPHIVSQNVYGITTSLLSAAVTNGVRRFVHCSSMARYGAQDTLPFIEDMEPKPQDPYGIAKLAAEMQVRCVSEVHGMDYVIAVPHNIIGARQKYDDPYRNVASIMVNLMLQGRQPFIYGDGEQVRSFSFVQDVVNPLLQLGYDPNVVGEVINIGPDDEFVTINTLTTMIARLMNFGPLEPIYKPGRPQEVKHATCSAEKARRLIGYETTTSLEEGLEDIVSYVRKRGPKPFLYHLGLEIVNDKTPDTWKDRLM